MFGQIDTLENTAEAREILEQVIQYKKEMYEKIRRKAAEVQIHLARRREELKGLEHKISNLEKKKLLSRIRGTAAGSCPGGVCADQQKGRAQGLMRSVGDYRRELA